MMDYALKVNVNASTGSATGYPAKTQYLASLHGMEFSVGTQMLSCYLLEGVGRENVIPKNNFYL
jgi:hypothetical protein